MATKPTLTSLARRAAVSTATASRVLNNSGPVSPDARAAVLSAAREIGYRHKAAPGDAPWLVDAAEAPRGSVVEVIWHWHSPLDRIEVNGGGALKVGIAEPVDDRSLVITRRAGHSFYRDMVNGILSELKDAGHKAMLQANHDLLAPSFLADVNSPGKVGLLLIGEYSPDLPKFVEACRQPLVLVDQLFRGWPDVVTIDNVGGVGSIMDHLLDLGHRRIGFIGGLPHVPMFGERKRAWVWRMLEAGLQVRPEWIYEGSGDIQHTQEAAAAILSRRQRPTAILCVNDSSALGAYRAAADQGLSIPGDVSVAGFDDIDAASLITPPLTTMRVPVVQMGRRAVRQLLGVPRNGLHTSEAGCEIRLRTQLVVRQSTAAPCTGG
jgi:DNA-binding LacI/PurR family transcriptional regulator